jgi:hypothetical protein
MTSCVNSIVLRGSCVGATFVLLDTALTLASGFAAPGLAAGLGVGFVSVFALALALAASPAALVVLLVA